MDAIRSALSQYRQATKHLPQLSERQQILTLKFELFHALRRGDDFQDRARALEARALQREAPASEREAMLDAFAMQLHAELARKAGDLDVAKCEHDQEARHLRVALVAAEAHCELLDELCYGLLATLEKAAIDQPAERRSESLESVEQAAS